MRTTLGKQTVTLVLLLSFILPGEAATINWNESRNRSADSGVTYGPMQFTRNYNQYHDMYHTWSDHKFTGPVIMTGCEPYTVTDNSLAQAVWGKLVTRGYIFESVSGSGDHRKSDEKDMSTGTLYTTLTAPARHASDTKRTLTIVLHNRTDTSMTRGQQHNAAFERLVNQVLANCNPTTPPTSLMRKIEFPVSTIANRRDYANNDHSKGSAPVTKVLSAELRIIPAINLKAPSSVVVTGTPGTTTNTTIPVTITTDTPLVAQVHTVATSRSPFVVTAVKPNETINALSNVKNEMNIPVAVTSKTASSGIAGTVNIDVSVL